MPIVMMRILAMKWIETINNYTSQAGGLRGCVVVSPPGRVLPLVIRSRAVVPKTGCVGITRACVLTSF